MIEKTIVALLLLWGEDIHVLNKEKFPTTDRE